MKTFVWYTSDKMIVWGKFQGHTVGLVVCPVGMTKNCERALVVYTFIDF